LLGVLVELAVRNLGVIPEARIPVGPGLVALTGETGAGKTMVVEALHLLLGGRPDPTRVRVGTEEASVEGLFAVGDTEWVLRRTVPAQGRSRAYVNGELATAATLAEIGGSLLELHGQHAQQALTQPRTQRSALDRFAGIDRAPFVDARRTVAACEAALAELGGDDRARARELDLCRFQVDEIDAVAPELGEDEALAAEEDLLAEAVTLQQSARRAAALLGDDGAADDLVARAVAALGEAAPFTAVRARLVDLGAELSDCTAELRRLGDVIEPDDERLAAVRDRRHALVQLRRKYGDTLAEVLAHRDEMARRADELGAHDEVREQRLGELDRARARLGAAATALGAARRTAAPQLAAAVAAHLGALALPGARMEVDVADTPEHPGAGEAVEFRLAANTGVAPASLSRVASGGELSRVMLALRLVLSEGPPTMVFDEVDAGIGGEAAVAVGRALSELGRDRQVLVVTHLPQVAAFADSQIEVRKSQEADGATTTARVLAGEERVVELSRMLSGSPDSDVARRHAEELLASADGVRRGPRTR
jgi:DNA repair protein RecN (Recombination protein N)